MPVFLHSVTQVVPFTASLNFSVQYFYVNVFDDIFVIVYYALSFYFIVEVFIWYSPFN